ncbi:hypothetical protein [Enterovirga aerilata]|uniref:Uncharacterized protein n=1 Tax=Enterovirga aerilata TaxID=2730920 RepID=A0A849I238_9HYPH|nr:hypothetical protein [Enterovirga sp. DB1703]NNM71421.1 hypothetical protein [Enterovirga sp. DB1703]
MPSLAEMIAQGQARAEQVAQGMIAAVAALPASPTPLQVAQILEDALVEVIRAEPGLRARGASDADLDAFRLGALWTLKERLGGAQPLLDATLSGLPN